MMISTVGKMFYEHAICNFDSSGNPVDGVAGCPMSAGSCLSCGSKRVQLPPASLGLFGEE